MFVVAAKRNGGGGGDNVKKGRMIEELRRLVTKGEGTGCSKVISVKLKKDHKRMWVVEGEMLEWGWGGETIRDHFEVGGDGN